MFDDCDLLVPYVDTVARTVNKSCVAVLTGDAFNGAELVCSLSKPRELVQMGLCQGKVEDREVL